MSIEGIPEGWEFVRIGTPIFDIEIVLGHDGKPRNVGTRVYGKNYVIIRKIEKPKQYRPFANAAEFEPHRDRWIKRLHSGNQNAKGAFRVSGYDDCAVWGGGGVRGTYQEMFDDGREFDDGTPFGVEVAE